MALYNKNRIQVMISDELKEKITANRKDTPESLFVRKIIESHFN